MVTSVKLENFRSHQNLDIDFSSNNIAIIGNNATGKTNILEAIYYSFITKSFRGSQLKIINNDQDYMKLQLGFNITKPHLLEYRLIKGGSLKRTIKLNEIIKKPSDIIGIQPIVIFLPDDVRIITDSPTYRRNMLNSVLIQTSKNYLLALNKFQKILNQRNKLLYSLKHNRSSSSDQLFIYNLQLAEPISELYTERDNLINHINNSISEKYSLISGGKDNIQLEYLKTLPKNKDDIVKYLEKYTQDDLRLGYSSRGPHKDELVISLNHLNTREGLSRGENRSLVLALKLIELEYINQQTNIAPILLLDDVLSELDENRQSHLLGSTNSKQTILTSTTISPNINNFETIKL